MEPNAFGANAPDQLVRTSTNNVEHWAFVPNPLPPNLTLTTSMWTCISEADRALGELAGLGRNTDKP